MFKKNMSAIEVPEITIPIDNAPEVSIQIATPVVHNRRECPGAPKKEIYRFLSLEEEIEQIYQKAENTNAILDDDGYFPVGARCLVGRKYYKTFSVNSPVLIPMKVLLLLVKSEFGWLRTNVQMEDYMDDSKEWDVEFVY